MRTKMCGPSACGGRTYLPGAAGEPAPALTTALASQVLPTDELAEPKKSHRQSHRKKVLPEIYLTRLLSTKVGPASSPRLGRAARVPTPGWGPGLLLHEVRWAPGVRG